MSVELDDDGVCDSLLNPGVSTAQSSCPKPDTIPDDISEDREEADKRERKESLSGHVCGHKGDDGSLSDHDEEDKGVLVEEDKGDDTGECHSPWQSKNWIDYSGPHPKHKHKCLNILVFGEDFSMVQIISLYSLCFL